MGCEQSIQVEPIQEIKLSESQQVRSKRVRMSALLKKFNQHFKFDCFASKLKSQFQSIKIPGSSEFQGMLKSLLDKFDDFYLDRHQQVQLLEFIAKLIKSKLKKKLTKGGQVFHTQNVKKLQQFYQRVFKKNKLCLKVFKYTSKHKSSQTGQVWSQEVLKFDLGFEEVKSVAGKARELCEFSMDAFSLLTLYLMHSVHNLYTKGKSFEQIQGLLQESLQKLQKLYPATNPQQSTLSSTSPLNLNTFTFTKPQQTLTFKTFLKSHYDQLIDYILQKAEHAQQQQEDFVQLVKSICLQKGYGFKSGTKITSSKSVSSIERTVEKLLSSEKYEVVLKEWKKGKMDGVKINGIEMKNGLKSYVDSEKLLIMTKVKEILQNQKQIEFTAKDLLRGKCMFQKVQDVIQTLQKLRVNIQEKGYSIYQIKDRLSKKTRDLTLIST